MSEEAIAALGYAAATTRWHLSVEGGFAWYLAGSAFPLRARHFAGPPPAGCPRPDRPGPQASRQAPHAARRRHQAVTHVASRCPQARQARIRAILTTATRAHCAPRLTRLVASGQRMQPIRPPHIAGRSARAAHVSLMQSAREIIGDPWLPALPDAATLCNQRSLRSGRA